MASFEKAGNGWRVSLFRYGHRLSKTFRTKKEGEEWARTAGAELRLVADTLPRRRKGEPVKFTEEQIVRRAKPYAIVCGIYFLVKSGGVVYVGQSVDVHARVASHTDGKDFDALYVLPCDAEHLNRVEEEYIQRLNPPLNVARKLRFIE